MLSNTKEFEANIIKATKLIEDNLDAEIERLDKMKDDDLEALRQRRLKEMKQQSIQRSEWLAAGHGVYSELSNEKEFFAATKTSTYGFACHFYRDSTFRCKIVDKHLSLLAPKHVECRMVKINVEKAPFLTKKLKVVIIPTIVLVKDEKVCDKIIGFDDLGGHDEFSTAMLEYRLALGKVIKYDGDLHTPPDGNKQKTFNLKHLAKKSIRDSNQGGSDYSD